MTAQIPTVCPRWTPPCRKRHSPWRDQARFLKWMEITALGPLIAAFVKRETEARTREAIDRTPRPFGYTGRQRQMSDNDEFGEWCSDIGEQHDWSAWVFSQVGTHECRFCSRCGGMEQQWVCTDENCTDSRAHGGSAPR